MKVTHRLATLLLILFFTSAAHTQTMLPPINVTAPGGSGVGLDFMGDIGPPAKGPTVMQQAYIPVSPKLKCDFTRSLKSDLKNCDTNNPPNIGKFYLDTQVPRNQKFTKAVTFIANVGALQNGCGPANGMVSKIIPNVPLGFNFTNACNRHDVCYGSAIRKWECDAGFERDLAGVCGGSAPCDAIASLYSNAVKQYGDDAYQAAVEQYKCALYGYMRGQISSYLQYS